MNPVAGLDNYILASLNAISPKSGMTDDLGHGIQMALLPSGLIKPNAVNTNNSNLVPFHTEENIMPQEDIDKRCFERVPVCLPIKGKRMPRLFQSHPFEGQSQNVSYNGLCIKVGANGFTPGEMIKLRTRLYIGDFLIKITGRVCWVSYPNDAALPVNVGIQLMKTRHYNLWCKRIDEELLKM